MQELVLGRSSQSTIDIYGGAGKGNLSVSTWAVQNNPGILSQNDRKLMMFRHEDGSFSVHVFIGATGVNKVDVRPETEPVERGTTAGNMQMGSDKYEKEGKWEAASDKTTRDGLRKVRMGERHGKFPQNGSTVISFYLPNDFSLMPKLASHQREMGYEGANKTENIETLMKMGTPILVKTDLLAVQVLERWIPDQFEKLDASPAAIKDLIPQVIRHIENRIKDNDVQDLTESQKRYLQHDIDFLKKVQEGNAELQGKVLSALDKRLAMREKEQVLNAALHSFESWFLENADKGELSEYHTKYVDLLKKESNQSLNEREFMELQAMRQESMQILLEDLES